MPEPGILEIESGKEELIRGSKKTIDRPIIFSLGDKKLVCVPSCRWVFPETRNLDGTINSQKIKTLVTTNGDDVLLTLGVGKIDEKLSVGREKGNNIQLNGESVSRRHADIGVENGGFYFEDHSLNGTTPEEVKEIQENRLIPTNDLVAFQLVLYFEIFPV